jgi:hypothetical protein
VERAQTRSGDPLSPTTLERRRDAALRPRGPSIVKSTSDAERFLERVAIALRYGPGPSLPLASMYDATSGGAAKGPFIEAAELTNHLLGTATAIEVNVIAGRLTLVHRSIVPALYALARRGRPVDDLSGLDLDARHAFALIRRRHEVTAGEVRAHVGATFDARHDPGYEALAALQRLLLVDRGPYEINTKGIHYLSKEGYPYHFFHEAHDDLVRASRKLTPADAADALLGRYLTGAVWCAVRTVKSMFKLLLVPEDVDAALARLAAARAVSIETVDRQRVAIAGG